MPPFIPATRRFVRYTSWMIQKSARQADGDEDVFPAATAKPKGFVRGVLTALKNLTALLLGGVAGTTLGLVGVRMVGNSQGPLSALVFAVLAGGGALGPWH